MQSQWVEIEFDCLPLRMVTRLDVPVDASPRYQQLVISVKEAIDQHGTHNAYFLHNATCTFHLTNDPEIGLVQFEFSGTALTDHADMKTRLVELKTRLKRETCDWLNEPIVDFFATSVRHAVRHEFDRYIAAGDKSATEQRVQKLQDASDSDGGFIGMYL